LSTAAVFAYGLAVSLGLIAFDRLGVVHLESSAVLLVERVNFNATLLHGMLGAQLFAGARHVAMPDDGDSPRSSKTSHRDTSPDRAARARGNAMEER
jgi:hypothetical protein